MVSSLSFGVFPDTKRPNSRIHISRHISDVRSPSAWRTGASAEQRGYLVQTPKEGSGHIEEAMLTSSWPYLRPHARKPRSQPISVSSGGRVCDVYSVSAGPRLEEVGV